MFTVSPTRRLRRFLSKLGIKSADILPFEEIFEIFGNFGDPDKLFMNPISLEQIQKTLVDSKDTKEKK